MVAPIPFKAHKVGWLSAESIEDNFENHYGNKVRQLNKLEHQLAMLKGTIDSYSERLDLNRKMHETAVSIEFHELYFNSMRDASEENFEFKPGSHLGKAITHEYGSIESLMTEFYELSNSASSDFDWMVLAWSKLTGHLTIMPVDNRPALPFDLQPVLPLNLQPNVYSSDFTTDRDKYVSSFLHFIHWGRVIDRFNAVHRSGSTTNVASTPESMTVNDLKVLSENNDDAPLVLDVRHTDDRERYRHRIMETEWRDSFNVSSWAGELPKDKTIVVYCMYGFWVSQDVATELRANGYDARTLLGGINSWRAMGYGESAI